MPRFVLLYHECPPDYQRPSHWDFMLECDDILRTWALAELPRDWQAAYERTRAIFRDCPSLANQNAVAAQRLADHRRDFLDFEGELTNNRGHVICVAEGTFVEEWRSSTGWFLSLSGKTVACSIELDRRDDDHTQWTMSVRA